MPNHITNILTITAPEGHEVKELIEFVSSNESKFDFNTIIPMPATIIESFGTPGINPPWYKWSIENWGTKWNAYDISVDGNVIRFDTAWSCPMPIFKELHRKFPNFTIDIKYADEDWGHNFGHVTFTPEGVLLRYLPEEGTPEARVWVFKNVRGSFPEYYDENGNYIGEDE